MKGIILAGKSYPFGKIPDNSHYPFSGISNFQNINQCMKLGNESDKMDNQPSLHFSRKPKQYTISKDFLLQEYAKNKRSQDEIAKQLGISQWVISQRLREYGIPTRPKTWKFNPRKYLVNEHFFDTLTVENAWVLGWLLSDGFINKVNQSHAFGVKVNERDIDVLYKIRSLIGYSGRILSAKTHLAKTNKTYHHSLLKISSKVLVKRLEHLGVRERKTERETFLGEIQDSGNEDLIRAFIKGIFEGDGSILFTKKSLVFQIVGTKELLSAIQRFLIKFVHATKTKLTHNIKESNHWALRYRGNNQALRIFDWLYLNSKLHLDRKYNKYCEIKRVLKI